MNVFIYSEDEQLLITLAKALRKEGETPLLVPDFKTLMKLVVRIDPDIAFLDENLFPKERIGHIQRHVFDVLHDFPVTSMTDPYFTDYRGRLTEEEFKKTAEIVKRVSNSYNYKIKMSPKLDLLLNFMLSRKGENINTDTLIDLLWKENNEAHRKTLHTYIFQLREKLKESGNKFRLEKISKKTYSLITDL